MTDFVSRNTVLAGAALYLLIGAPSSVREPALIRLRQVLSDVNVGRLTTGLKVLLGLGTVKGMNNFLSELASNNFYLRSDKEDWIWNKEVAVVTGGASGFGALFSKDLAAKGIHVVALDINEPPEDIRRNPRITFFTCDVTSPDAVNEVAEQIKQTIGHPSILINNAGIGSGLSILDSPLAYVRKLFEVNIVSHYSLIQAFLPDMIAKKKGHIVSIASIASFVSPPGMSHYSASKSAVLALHEALGSELRTLYNCPEIKTTIVHPGWADTPILKDAVESIRKSGGEVLDPQVVSDAVVKQISSCRGGQLIIMKGSSVISIMRAFPLWLQHLLKQAFERHAKRDPGMYKRQVE